MCVCLCVRTDWCVAALRNAHFLYLSVRAGRRERTEINMKGKVGKRRRKIQEINWWKRQVFPALPVNWFLSANNTPFFRSIFIYMEYNNMYALKYVNAQPYLVLWRTWFSMHVWNQRDMSLCGVSCLLLMLFSCSRCSLVLKESFLCSCGNKVVSVTCTARNTNIRHGN